jgi:hypothetical protein
LTCLCSPPSVAVSWSLAWTSGLFVVGSVIYALGARITLNEQNPQPCALTIQTCAYGLCFVHCCSLNDHNVSITTNIMMAASQNLNGEGSTKSIGTWILKIWFQTCDCPCLAVWSWACHLLSLKLRLYWKDDDLRFASLSVASEDWMRQHSGKCCAICEVPCGQFAASDRNKTWNYFYSFIPWILSASICWMLSQFLGIQ